MRRWEAGELTQLPSMRDRQGEIRDLGSSQVLRTLSQFCKVGILYTHFQTKNLRFREVGGVRMKGSS